MKKNKMCVVLVLLFISQVRGQEVMDGIVAIVGDNIILRSELMQTAQGFAIQMGVDWTKQEKEFETLKKDILENLIYEKVLLDKAEEDTITVEEQMVSARLDAKIQEFIQQLGSEERVEREFGMSIKKIKKNYRESVRNQLIVETVQAEKLQNIQISRREVEQFFESMKDSLPEKSEQVHLRHILLSVQVSDTKKDEALQKITSIRDRILQGEDFEELANIYSEDPGTASRGGNLGTVERGILNPDFEEEAFQLENMEISEIIETPLGFHIIQMVDNRETEADLRHILIRLERTEDDEARVIEKIKSIRERILAGEDFGEMAKAYSDDETSKVMGGDLGWLPINMLQIQAFKDVVDTLGTGEVSEIFKTPFGYHLVKIEGRKASRTLDLKDDWDEIYNMALNMKHQNALKEWYETLKKDIYIKVNEDLI